MSPDRLPQIKILILLLSSFLPLPWNLEINHFNFHAQHPELAMQCTFTILTPQVCRRQAEQLMLCTSLPYYWAVFQPYRGWHDLAKGPSWKSKVKPTNKKSERLFFFFVRKTEETDLTFPFSCYVLPPSSGWSHTLWKPVAIRYFNNWDVRSYLWIWRPPTLLETHEENKGSHFCWFCFSRSPFILCNLSGLALGVGFCSSGSWGK